MMKHKFEIPLSVNVLYHEKYNEGSIVYEKIYHSLCCNPNKPFIDGMGIPVYFTTGGNQSNIKEIDFSRSKCTAILLLIDDEMFIDDIWRNYVKELVSTIASNDNIKIYPIKLCEFAFNMNDDFQKSQFIVLKNDSIINSYLDFRICLFDNLIRLIKGKAFKKNKLFISHSKKDVDHLGEDKANELKRYLREKTKLDSFFDRNDILDGYPFDEQIKENEKNSLLIILDSPTYSEREWCKLEVLLGKEHQIPAISVSFFEGVIRRRFPYMDNIPIVRFRNNWNEVIALLLETALKQYYQRFLLENIKSSLNLSNTIVLSSTPELLSLCYLGDYNQIIYPEPPIGSEELVLLKKIVPTKNIITPMQVYLENGNLKNKHIAVSISESDDLLNLGIGKSMLDDFSVELARHILAAGGKLVYGGDLRKGGFTELFSELSYKYGCAEKTSVDTNYFVNYFSWPIYNKLNIQAESHFKNNRVDIVKVLPPEECANELKNTFVCPDNEENIWLWGKALLKMREEMERNIDARVVLGGRLSGFLGRMPGICEEVLCALKVKHPIYLLGGFGGATKMMADVVSGIADIKSLIDKILKSSGYQETLNLFQSRNETIDYGPLEQLEIDGWKSLNNGLNKEDNEVLFHSTNIFEIIALILKGLNNNIKE